MIRGLGPRFFLIFEQLFYFQNGIHERCYPVNSAFSDCLSRYSRSHDFTNYICYVLIAFTVVVRNNLVYFVPKNIPRGKIFNGFIYQLQIGSPFIFDKLVSLGDPSGVSSSRLTQSFSLRSLLDQVLKSL